MYFLDVVYTNAQERVQVYNKEMDVALHGAQVSDNPWPKQHGYSYQVLIETAEKRQKVQWTQDQPLRSRKNENDYLELLCRIYGYNSFLERPKNYQ